MNRLIILLFLFFGMIGTANAQQKQLTLEELLPGGVNYAQCTPKTEREYKWMGDELLSFDDNNIYDSKNKVLLTKGELRAMANNDKINLMAISFVEMGGKYYAHIVVPGEKLLCIDLNTKSIEEEIKIKKDWENLDFNPFNRTLAFTKSKSLYIVNANSQPFTDDETEEADIIYGQAVHRNEFGINKGMFWSPEGTFLAFYRMDESMVGDYPLVDISAREAKLNNIKYPMAGMASHEVRVGLYHIQSGQTIFLKTGAPADRYFTNIAWDPSESYLYVAELNREQNHMHFNKYHAETGIMVQTLFEEKSDRYVEPQHPMLFLNTNPVQFIWQSQRDGFNHLYLYDTEGKLIRQLTSGNYDVTQVVGLDKDDKHIYYISNEENPIEFQLYKTELKTGKKTRLSQEPGVHNAQLSASGKYIIDKYSNQTTPLVINLITTKNGKIERLQSAPDPYEGIYTLPEISLGTIKAADGKTDLYYRLVKPTNFDPGKKYPTVVYVYGGPHNQSVRNSWMGAVRGWDIYMAQQGYVIFTLDNRGTDNRGFEFESIIHRQLGKHEVADQMKGVEFLHSLPYVDKDRMGVHGWSYGGFLTASLLLRHPDVFKVGVAGGPVIDWKYYEVMYGERYMDTPQENPQGYDEANINKLAGNLKGRFLLIHGDNDNTVVWQNSLSFLKACIEARTYPDYFVYPGHGHNMMGPDRIHLHQKITQYFNDFLK